MTHPHGLEHDLATLSRKLHERRIQERRQALLWLAAGGAAIGLAASVPDDATSSSSACAAAPQETNGPFPSDGSNTAQGAPSDILRSSGIVRRNIRSSFGTAAAIAPGVPVVLTLRLVGVGSGCAALADHAVYVWQCDSDGQYSLYGSRLENQNYLRGVQVSDERGQVTFETIFPACYSGRYPHIHIEVYPSLAAAVVYTRALLTTQLALPGAICAAVYDHCDLYRASIANFAQVSAATDRVFAASSPTQLAAQTPAFEGSVATGFTGTITIGVPG